MTWHNKFTLAQNPMTHIDLLMELATDRDPIIRAEAQRSIVTGLPLRGTHNTTHRNTAPAVSTAKE